MRRCPAGAKIAQRIASWTWDVTHERALSPADLFGGKTRTRTRTNTNPNGTEANAAGRSGNARALRTRTRTNTNPNDTEANAAGRSGSARALRKTKQVLNNSRGGGALAKSLAKSVVFVGVVHSAGQQRGRRASKDAQELLPRPRSGSE